MIHVNGKHRFLYFIRKPLVFLSLAGIPEAFLCILKNEIFVSQYSVLEISLSFLYFNRISLYLNRIPLFDHLV